MNITNEVAEVLPITFYRYRKDGSLNPDIKRAFLQTCTLRVEDAIAGHVLLEDKSEWTLVLEPPVHEAFKRSSLVDCIVSFQIRKGGCYAVARLFKEQQHEHTTTSSLVNSTPSNGEEEILP